MKFSRWLEAGGLDDPDAFSQKQADDLGALWRQKLPKGHEPFNDSGIQAFVDSMADPAKNGRAIAMALGLKMIEEHRYSSNLTPDLILVDDDELGVAEGIVTNAKPAVFNFYDGDVKIQHPPLVFDKDDELLLESIIRHELGHAIDSINPVYQNIPSSGQFTKFYFHAELYAKNMNEVRRLGSQLRFLLQKVGDPNKVMNLIRGKRNTDEKVRQLRQQMTGPQQVNIRNQLMHLGDAGAISPFKFPPALLPVAEAFLSYFKPVTAESWLSNLAGPVLGGVLAGSSPQAIPPAQPIVQQVQMDYDKKAASLVAQILGMMQFRKYFVQGACPVCERIHSTKA